MELTESVARKVLETVDAGLVSGIGKPVAGQMCVEAAVCFTLGLPHSDNPPCVGYAVRKYKIQLNDSLWSSKEARAKGMRRVAVAQLGSNEIDQRAFVEHVTIQCVRRVLPIALHAAAKRNPAHADAILATVPACETAGSPSSARQAAEQSRKACRAAYAADAAAYAYAADAAAYAYAAAAAAADAAAYAAADAAAYAAAYAADAAAYAYAAAAAAADAAAYAAAYAADAAADAAAYAADAAARDSTLSLAAEIAVEALQAQGCKGCEWLFLCEAA